MKIINNIGRKKSIRSVNPNLYTKEYFEACEGFSYFNKSKGKDLGPRHMKVISNITLRKGMKVLDIGCGRGELVFWAAKRGADAIGIDYSKTAINMAKKAIKTQKQKFTFRPKFLLKDAKNIDFKENSFDMVFMIDVLEHLYPEEQDVVLSKVHIILKRGGCVIGHTDPNKIFLDFTYKYWSYPISTILVWIWNIFFNKSYGNLQQPDLTRNKYAKKVHVNEENYFHLLTLFKRHKFYVRIITKPALMKPVFSWKDSLYNIFVNMYPLSNYFPLNAFFTNNFLIIAYK